MDVLLLNPYVTATREDGASVGTIGVPEDYIVRCINAGVLSLATWVAQCGRSVHILDFLDDPDLEPLRTWLSRERPRIVGISVMTGFAYEHARQLASEVRRLAPEVMIVLGGQHVGPFAPESLDDVPEADVTAFYEGETVLAALLEVVEGGRALADVPGIAWATPNGVHVNRAYPPLVPLDDFSPLRYDLYPAYASFTPYVEESRGCFAKCSYCITPFTNQYKIRTKKPDRLLAEIDHAAATWGTDFGTLERPLALLASTFGVRTSDTIRLLDGLGARGLRWTSEFRADGALGKRLDFVADSGARALFVGAESCSPTQLVRMQKTPAPESYLASLSRLLEASTRHADVLVKLGFLFYIGETKATLAETEDFLRKHAESIRWVSASPLFVFGGTPLAQSFDDYREAFGASLHERGFWKENRVYACNVSEEFSFNHCVDEARRLEETYRRPDAFDIVFERAPVGRERQLPRFSTTGHHA